MRSPPGRIAVATVANQDVVAIAYTNATAYSENVMDIKNLNVGMTHNAVHAVDQLCASMKFFLLQTGTNVSAVQ